VLDGDVALLFVGLFVIAGWLQNDVGHLAKLIDAPDTLANMLTVNHLTIRRSHG
jgi:hypothetical protein